MFSVITTASSITMPIAIAIAPSVMRLNVWPPIDMMKTVIAIVIGIDDALIAVMRACRRKISSTIMARTAPTTNHSAGQRLAHRGRDGRDAVGDVQRVAADVARDVDQRGGFSVARDDSYVVLGSSAHRCEVADTQPA